MDGDHIDARVAKRFERSTFLRRRPVEPTVLETASIGLDIVRTDLRLDNPFLTHFFSAPQQRPQLAFTLHIMARSL